MALPLYGSEVEIDIRDTSRPMPPRAAMPEGARRFDDERIRAAEAKRARKAARLAPSRPDDGGER